jgi:release factor glutamine methyltransferase
MSASARDPALRLGAITGRLRAAGCVFAEAEARLLTAAAESPAALRDMVERRVAGLPLEHIIGWAEFCGLRIVLEPGVFVPRPRSELLVRLAAARTAPGSVVVDLACGSGAIGAAIAAIAGQIELHACDVDQAAVRCARRNLAAARGHVHAGDLYAALPDRLRGRVGVIAANVPYVPSEAVVLMPAEARMHEPLLALDGGHDGLDVLRRAAAGAGGWLAPGGHLLIETSSGQAQAAAAEFAAAGLAAQIASDEDLGATVIVGEAALTARQFGPDRR